MAVAMFYTSFFLLLYIYPGYFIILYLLKLFIVRNRTGIKIYQHPPVTVIIAAFDEDAYIEQRILNLLSQDYPRDNLEIIIASDGSTDGTVDTARKYEASNVLVLDFKQRRGRSMVHNDAIKQATGQIVVFSDAETEFDAGFITNITSYFLPEVGCAVGNLVYRTNANDVSRSDGLYWRFEKKLKQLECANGILFKTSGACTAVRRDLWRDLNPEGDCDFVTPLDVILQGYKVAYAPDAKAYDRPSSSLSAQFRTRVRQSSKSFISTIRRWGWKGWVKHPLVSVAILSHKILRWLTIYFMILLLISNCLLATRSRLYLLALIVQLCLYSMVAVAGVVEVVTGKRLPVISSFFAFCMVCVAFAVGTAKGILGRAPAVYINK